MKILYLSKKFYPVIFRQNDFFMHFFRNWVKVPVNLDIVNDLFLLLFLRIGEARLCAVPLFLFFNHYGDGHTHRCPPFSFFQSLWGRSHSAPSPFFSFSINTGTATHRAVPLSPFFNLYGDGHTRRRPPFSLFQSIRGRPHSTHPLKLVFLRFSPKSYTHIVYQIIGSLQIYGYHGNNVSQYLDNSFLLVPSHSHHIDSSQHRARNLLS